MSDRTFQNIYDPVSSEDPAIPLFKYVSGGGDYIVCHYWDGTTEGTDLYYIAKPWLLRRTPFDGLARNGITYTYLTDVRRFANDGVESEYQVVVPSWVSGDVISARRGYVANVVDAAGLAIFWLADCDRAWAQESP
jgi:hypothetical protein